MGEGAHYPEPLESDKLQPKQISAAPSGLRVETRGGPVHLVCSGLARPFWGSNSSRHLPELPNPMRSPTYFHALRGNPLIKPSGVSPRPPRQLRFVELPRRPSKSRGNA